MAIRSNSKKAIENIKKYIAEGFCEEFAENQRDTYTLQEMAGEILSDLRRVKGDEVKRYSRFTWQDAFCEWAAGLPGIFDTCYYYNRSAVDDLGKILEESDTEKARFSESEAESLLSRLIFRELVKAAPDVLR